MLGPRQPAQDEADVGDEAQIEHAVGLIEHQHLHVSQVEHVLLEVVDEPAGRADQHVDAVGERTALLVVVGAAEHHRQLQTGVLAELPAASLWICTASSRVGATISARTEVGVRLGSRGGLVEQRLKQRHQERGGLAGAGLCLAGDIASLQRDRQRLSLDRRAIGEAGIDDSLHQCGSPAAGS